MVRRAVDPLRGARGASLERRLAFFLRPLRTRGLAMVTLLLLGWMVDAGPVLAQNTQQYFYDALGRLVGVSNGPGNGVVYRYDAVGNLLAIERITSGPTISSMTPSVIAAGSIVAVTIEGSGFFGISLATSNPEILISNLQVQDTTLTATFAVPNPSVFGSTTVTVTAVGGSVSTTLTVNQPVAVIARLTPDSGLAGIQVGIEGTGFGTTAGSNRVTFAGLNGTRVEATISSETSTAIQVMAPSGVTTGPVTVEVGGLTSNLVPFRALTLTGIVATALQGTPADPTKPSGNVIQSIPVQGAELSASSRVVFPTLSATGSPGTIEQPLFSIAPDGTSASAVVPRRATTGIVTIKQFGSGAGTGAVPFQIVPAITTFVLPAGQALAPGVVATVLGTGLMEGGTTADFPGAPSPVPVTDVFDANSGLEPNGGLTVTVPAGTTTGPFTVSTDGGRSNALLLSSPVLSGVVSTASSGTPADGAQASANVSQSVTLMGSGFANTTQVIFPTFDEQGLVQLRSIFPYQVSADGTSLDVFVPGQAVTGFLTVQDTRTRLGSGSALLQIVPTLARIRGTIAEGASTVLEGSGYEPGATEVRFPGVPQLVDTDTASIIQSGGIEASVIVPAGVDPTGQVVVVTSGGESGPLNASNPTETEPNDSPETATPLAVDSTVSATFDPVGDLDYFHIDVEAGQDYQVEILPADPLIPNSMNVQVLWIDQDGLTVLDGVSGGIVPEQPTPSLFLTPPATGTYYLRVEETGGQGGPEFGYQVRLSLPLAQ